MSDFLCHCHECLMDPDDSSIRSRTILKYEGNYDGYCGGENVADTAVTGNIHLSAKLPNLRKEEPIICRYFFVSRLGKIFGFFCLGCQGVSPKKAKKLNWQTDFSLAFSMI